MEETIVQEKVNFLPNPDVKREPIVPECRGCNKIYDTVQGMTGNFIAIDHELCIAYQSPKAKWRNYRIEKGTKKSKGKDVEVLYHLNPCNLANHISHSPKMDEMKKRSGWKKGKKW